MHQKKTIEMELQRHGRAETIPEVTKLYKRVTHNSTCNPPGAPTIELHFFNSRMLQFELFRCFFVVLSLSSFHNQNRLTHTLHVSSK